MNYFRVSSSLINRPDDYHAYGYEDKFKFLQDLCLLRDRWQGQVGECRQVKNGFRLVRFRNVHGIASDVWLPDFMLERASPPDEDPEMLDDDSDLDGILGPGW